MNSSTPPNEYDKLYDESDKDLSSLEKMVIERGWITEQELKKERSKNPNRFDFRLKKIFNDKNCIEHLERKGPISLKVMLNAKLNFAFVEKLVTPEGIKIYEEKLFRLSEVATIGCDEHFTQINFFREKDQTFGETINCQVSVLTAASLIKLRQGKSLKEAANALNPHEIREIAVSEKLYIEGNLVTDDLFCHVNILERLRDNFLNIQNLLELRTSVRNYFHYQEIICHPLFIFGLRNNFFSMDQFLNNKYFNLSHFPIFFHLLTAQHKKILDDNDKLITFKELYELFATSPQLFFHQDQRLFEFLFIALKNKLLTAGELLTVKEPEKLLSERGLFLLKMRCLFNDTVADVIKQIKEEEELNHSSNFANPITSIDSIQSRQSPKILLDQKQIGNAHPLFAIRKVPSVTNSVAIQDQHNKHNQIPEKKLNSYTLPGRRLLLSSFSINRTQLAKRPQLIELRSLAKTTKQ